MLVLLICLTISLSQAQIKVPTLSPFTKISQEVGLTEISLSYARPSAKGRSIFGSLVPYNKIWRTGANASTKLTFKEDVVLAGKNLKAGTYALYTIPGKTEWTIIIHGNTKHRSIAGDKYKEAEDIFRVKLKSKKIANFVETFTIQFSDIHTKGLAVTLSWENTALSIPIVVDVDKAFDMQIAELLKKPKEIKHGSYFRAAEYYLHNNRDLNKSLTWINEALEMSKENFRYGLLKAKILHKKGDKTSALKTIKLANKWAISKKNDNYIEQTSIFMKEIE